MIRFQEIVASVAELDEGELTAWIESGWVRPAGSGAEMRFDDADVARVRLIAECRFDLDIDADAMPVVLSLLDQVHGLRRELAALTEAVAGQPGDIRDEILAQVTRIMRLRQDD